MQLVNVTEIWVELKVIDIDCASISFGISPNCFEFLLIVIYTDK